MAIRLAAACVESLDPATGRTVTAGYSQGVAVHLDDATVTQCTPPVIGRIHAGRLSASGQILGACPLPCRIETPVILELELANRSVLRVSATALAVSFDGPANFAEALSC